jgi:hypothetical protein
VDTFRSWFSRRQKHLGAADDLAPFVYAGWLRPHLKAGPASSSVPRGTASGDRSRTHGVMVPAGRRSSPWPRKKALPPACARPLVLPPRRVPVQDRLGRARPARPELDTAPALPQRAAASGRSRAAPPPSRRPIPATSTWPASAATSAWARRPPPALPPSMTPPGAAEEAADQPSSNHRWPTSPDIVGPPATWRNTRRHALRGDGQGQHSRVFTKLGTDNRVHVAMKVRDAGLL